MNRSTDTRSDLYSLGATFYQTLTGCLPFAASDPMVWVYCHIEEAPATSRAAQVRAALFRHRHEAPRQDPRGTVSDRGWPGKDLRRCLAAWELRPHRGIPAWLSTTRRIAYRSRRNRTAWHRETEMLLAAFDHVVKTGTPEPALVSGYSGIGKILCGE